MSEILKIDLSISKTERVSRPELFNKYIGGGGLAAALLEEELDFSAEPFSPENVIVFTAGPLSPYYPCISKTAAVFRSPLTGEYGESHAGGRLACALRIAGLDAIVIKGRSDNLSYVLIEDEKVQILDARTLRGMQSTGTVSRILRDRHSLPCLSITATGKAGENGVKYACATVDSFRHFGRLGLGAVMGSKNLKALLVSGSGELPVREKKKYSETYLKAFKKVVATDAMSKYHDLGTAVNIGTLNHLGALPTRNFRSGSFEMAGKISGENFGEKFLARQTACMHCPIGCIHVASLREQFGDEHEFSTREVTYDYELIYALGSNLGVGDPSGVLRLIDACEKAGLDVISAGVCLSWATEAFEKEIIGPRETGINLIFGDVESYLRAIALIAGRKDDFWSALGEGVEFASEKYGGSEFAVAYGRNESPGYHTGAGAISGAMLGFRHSHLDNAGYSIDQKNMKGYESAEKLIDAIILEETQRQVITSLHSCLFARNVYTPEFTEECFDAIGIEMTKERLEEAGKRIFRLKNSIRKKLGYKFENLRIPGRSLQTATPMGRIEENFLREAVDIYRRKTQQ